MKPLKKSKYNRGSTLTLTIIVMILISSLGIALMGLTLSAFKMSVLNSDVSKAYYGSEAGARLVMKWADELVAISQEIARKDSADYINNWLKEAKDLTSDDPIFQDSGYPYYDDMTVNNKIVEQKYADIFKLNFKLELDKAFNPITSDYSQWLQTHAITNPISSNSNLSITNPQGSVINVSVVEADYNNSNPTSRKLSFTIKGKNNKGQDAYTKSIHVELELLVNPDDPTYYYTSVAKKTLKRPSIMQGKAAIAMGNVVSVGGSVRFNGDLVAFGSIPNNSGTEDMDADATSYGGIIAGMNKTARDDLRMKLDKELVPADDSGEITVDGNMATFGYIQVLNSDGEPSDKISKITGISKADETRNAFARAISVDEEGFASKITFGDQDNNRYDVTTTDDIQISADNSSVIVNGDYSGIYDGSNILFPGNGQALSQTSSLAPASPTPLTDYEKLSSSIYVNSDSEVNLNGKLYVGGSTLLELYDSADSATRQLKNYDTGLAIAKSGNYIEYGFKKDDDSEESTMVNSGNKLYWFDADRLNASPALDPYTVYSTESIPSINFQDYYYKDGTPVSLISGYDGMTGKFGRIERGMHYKKLWDDIWSKAEDAAYISRINTGDIHIKTDSNGKLSGFSYGAVAANYELYGSYKGFESPDPTVYRGQVLVKSQKYHEMMSDFLNNSDDEQTVNYVLPQRKVSDYFDFNNAAIVNKLISDTANNNFFYCGKSKDVYSGEVLIYKNSDGKWYIKDKNESTGSPLPTKNDKIYGVIYADNIYIKDGADFNGILASDGNIVFLNGDNKVTYDEAVLNNMITSSPKLVEFFKMVTYNYDVDNGETLLSRRNQVKNLKILQWKML